MKNYFYIIFNRNKGVCIMYDMIYRKIKYLYLFFKHFLFKK